MRTGKDLTILNGCVDSSEPPLLAALAHQNLMCRTMYVLLVYLSVLRRLKPHTMILFPQPKFSSNVFETDRKMSVNFNVTVMENILFRVKSVKQHNLSEY